MADLIDRDALCVSLFPLDKKDAVDIYRVIIDAPAVNRWIPCSERLPEKAGNYLCTLYYAIPPYNLFHPEKGTYIREMSVKFFDGKSFISSVIAWQPMPDAYEPPESEVQHD